MAERPITAVQRQRENAIFYTALADLALTLLMALVALASGSLTLIAEVVRMALLLMLEIISLIAMRRIHRGRFPDFEFGHGKIEQMANGGVAVGLFVAGAIILLTALDALTGEPQPLSPFALALGAAVAAINCFENFVSWLAMRRAARAEPNIMLLAQLRARQVKLTSSLVVQVTLTIAALTYDTLVAHWLDGLGAIFVSCLMIVSGVAMLRDSLPDLLDRGLREPDQQKILQVLTKHEASFATFDGIRTRRSADLLFIEVSLGFWDRLSMAEVDRRQEALAAEMQAALGKADVTVKARSVPTPESLSSEGS